MIRSTKEKKESKRVRSLKEISKKPFGKFKTINFHLMTKYNTTLSLLSFHAHGLFLHHTAADISLEQRSYTISWI